MSYLLMTGATGLVGQYVLCELLRTGERVAVLARDDKAAAAETRVDRLLRHFESEEGRALPRPVVISADLREPGAGLTVRHKQWIAAHCDRVLHCAAAMTFRKDARGEPFRTNVDGTRALLDLCRDCGIREFHHVSTAFICGLREGRVLETELDLGQALGNVYEESKLRAEQMVHAADWLNSVTIYRPASVVGDSRTGYVTSLHGFYLPLHLAYLMATQISVADMNERFVSTLGLRGDEGKNFVPVDWVADAIVHMLQNEDLHGRTYHLASPEPVPVAKLQRIIQESIDRFHPQARRTAATPVDLAAYEALFQQYMRIYESHWRNDPLFDLTNTRRALPHLPCPKLDDAMLMRLARYPIERGFNLARMEERTLADGTDGNSCGPVAPHLEHLLASEANMASPPEEHIGLQINGAGGGQWQLCLTGGQVTAAAPGLPPSGSTLLYLTASTFHALLRREITVEQSLQSGRILIENPSGSAAILPLLKQLMAV